MRQEPLAERLHAGEAIAGLQGWVDDVGVEDLLGGVDGRELKLLLRTEVGVEAALAHAGGLGEVSDRESLDAFDGRQAGGGVEDGAPAPLAVGAPPALPRCVGLDRVQSHT